ncbi:MAG: phosphate ABC transporter permease PstA [Xanthomonadaceae bacterium]|nr:phosphate ABC transporter permease PstA [Xanthomonadaceae bacterium]
MIGLYARRKLVDRISRVLMPFAAFIGLFFLAWILWISFSHGLSALRWDLFVNDTPPPGTDSYGMRNAFVGSLILIGMAMLLGIPVGLLAGTWLAEYGGQRRLARGVRFLNDIMLSAPSIEIGLFAYAILVDPLKHFSAISGSVALAMLMIPIVTRTTDEMLALVHADMRESAVALGAPMWKVISKITWKAARNGILTGILIALARIAGETAPLLFTAFGNGYWASKLTEPIAAMPLQIFNYAISPYDDWHRQAWAGALVLLLMVTVINVGVRVMTQDRFRTRNR